MPYGEFFKYLAVMAIVTYLIRMVPYVAFRKKITNRFVSSFLYYIPYAVLGAMTFPAIVVPLPQDCCCCGANHSRRSLH